MNCEARITVHQKGHNKPDYNEIHRRMALAGFSRVRMIGGNVVHELHGMYNKHTLKPLAAEQKAIESALQMTGFAFSIEIFRISETHSFNLEEAVDYSAMLASLLYKK